MLIFIAMNNRNSILHFKAKRTPLIILGVMALFCSRMLFFFFDDSEGPNLLIVVVFALLIYFISFYLYLFSFTKINGTKRLMMVICVQILLVIGLYYFLK